MKKYLSILIGVLAAFPLLTACSDDDGKIPAITITTGEIPAKNVFVTIDGTYIGTPGDGVTELTGTLDPSATEQHLQLSCPSMYNVIPSYNDEYPFDKIIPVFDITISMNGGKYIISGKYSGKGYDIALTGDLSTNYNGETDWHLYFERIGSGGFKLEPFCGNTFDIEFTSEDIYCKPEFENFYNPDLPYNPVEMTDAIFPKIPEAYAKNSGCSGARISFREDGHYDLWFRDKESGELIKDDSEHRYLTAIRRLYLIDEPQFIEKQSEMFDLSSVGLSYDCSKMCFAKQKIAYDVFSSKEWCITECKSDIVFETTFILPANDYFLQCWELSSDFSSPLDREFAILQGLEMQSNVRFVVNPTAILHLVENAPND